MRRASTVLVLVAFACVDRSFPEGLECDPAFGCPGGQSCLLDLGGTDYRCWSHDAAPAPDALQACVPDETSSCYSGPPGSETGSCHAGVQTCDDDSTWGPCDGEVTPSLQCDGRECGDDGCSGTCGTCEADVDCDLETGKCLRGATISIAAGSFSMGSPAGEPGRGTDEPSHLVTLDAFEIDRLEVTNQAYLQCVLDGACEAPTTCDAGVPTWTGPITYPSAMAHHPVTCVSWDMAAAYCAWTGERLCSEAEWERAATGTVHRVYPWGDTFPVDPNNYLNCDEGYCFDEHDGTAPVGTFASGVAVESGASDLAGNVSEWVLDFYDATFYTTGTQVNPKGPCDGVPEVPCDTLFVRAHRGGSFATPSALTRCSARGQRAQSSREQYIGIRCCQDAI